MCLETMDRKIKYKRGTGYKIFIRDFNSKLTSKFFFITYKYGYNEDKNDYIIDTTNYKSHKTGFFLFKNKKDAFKYGNMITYEPVIKKVRFSKVVATGKQHHMDVIVARRIFIYKENIKNEDDIMPNGNAKVYKGI